MRTPVTHAFILAINQRNPDEIAALMTEDHIFTDSLGNKIHGREPMRKGWQGYFGLVPDYIIEVEETFTAGPVVVMLGAARGTYAAGGEIKPENRWRTPAAWRAVVRGELIAEWQVYADNEPLRRLMR